MLNRAEQEWPEQEKPRYTVNGRIMRDYEDANLYWQVYGGTLMEKLDRMTPAHVLQTKPEVR
jgi:acyl-CoA hydrolase